LSDSPRSGQIGGSFDHDRNICYPRTVEAKAIRSHTKAAVANLRLWIPQYCWNAALGGKVLSTGCARQAIDGHIIGIVENKCADRASRVAIEDDSFQIGAMRERSINDIRDAAANRDRN
jgi:hypothetical protein